MWLKSVMAFLFFVSASLVSAQTLQALHLFNFADGSNPGKLTLGVDGNFYGTTTYGGSYGGNVFYNYGYGYGPYSK